MQLGEEDFWNLWYVSAYPPRRSSATHKTHWLPTVIHYLLAACCLCAVVASFQAQSSNSDGAPFVTAQALATAHPQAGLVGVKRYYLALGDSLAYGLQPNLNTSQGYATQWFEDLRQYGSQQYINYSCVGETTTTFIYGKCPLAWAEHAHHRQPQLHAAVAFLKAHVGQVSPVSLDIGANDMLGDISLTTCKVSENWEDDLAGMDWNLDLHILPALTSALTGKDGKRTGDLVMMNYYNPYQNLCPNAAPYMRQLNAHLAHDAAAFHISLVDVYTAFGSVQTPNAKICQYTWMCGVFRDIELLGGGIHATTRGYQVIAQAFEARTGY